MANLFGYRTSALCSVRMALRGIRVDDTIACLLLAFLLTAGSVYAQQDPYGTKTNQRDGGKTGAGRSEAGKRPALPGYGRLPLSFEVNRGQANDQVKFLSRGPGFSLFLTSTEAVLALSNPQKEGENGPSLDTRPAPSRKLLTNSLHMKLVGANPAPRIGGLEEMAGKSNYFIGNDPKSWRVNVPNYAKVKYVSVWPGVDLAYYGNQRQLEHDFIVSPGADPRAITLGFDGKEKLRIDDRGDLVIRDRIGEVRLEKPVVYQELGGIRQQVAGEYALKGRNQVGFRIGKYDVTKTLVIDPVLSYSTYLNGTFAANEWGTAIAIDSAGSAYVTGKTDSGSFPTTAGAFSTTSTYGLVKAFVMKLNTNGSGLIYSTYLGGSGGDYGQAIAVDSAGAAYVTGTSGSADFPVTAGAFQTSLSGAGFKPFVTKLNSTGSALIYSTYLGGTGGDYGFGIAVDSAGSAYVVGHTGSTNFPVTAGALRTTNSWPSGFVTKLNAAGSGLIYSTYLGSNDYYDNCNAVAVDSTGFAYVTGSTFTYPNNTPTGFPVTPGAFQTGTPLENPTAFVTKMNLDGSGLIYSTFLGGHGAFSPRGIGGESGQGIAVDSTGSAYVTGTTYSPDFPTTPGAFQTTFSGLGADFFVTKLNSGGSALIYSTFLGGTTYARSNAFDPPNGIALDSAGFACVTGTTNSASFPTTPDALQSTLGGAPDAFVTKLSADGSGLVYSTYLGGSNTEWGLGIAVDSADSVYVTGYTNSFNFPTTAGVFQTTPPADSNGTGYIAKFENVQSPTTTTLTSSLNPSPFGQSVTYTATVTTAGSAAATGTVTFYDGATSLGSSALSGTQAVFSTSTLSTGTHSITADYSGDANFAGSASPPLSQTVNKATPSITWPAPAAIIYGTPLSATQLNATANVSGTFVYSPATGTTLNAGTSSLSVTFTPLDTTDYTTASASVSITVALASTTVGLSSSVNPSAAGQRVTFSAIIAPQLGGTATGTVTFNDGATTLGTTALTANAAAVTVSTLTAGMHSITASYSGDANFTGSTSTALAQTVNKATPSITWPAPAAITYGTLLSATQLNATASVPGTFAYSPALGTTLSAGTSLLNVTFTPSDITNYTTASASVSINVNKASTTVGLSASVNPSSFGQAVTFAAMISPQLGGTATGTVTFNDGAATLGTAAISANSAAFIASTLAAGTHSITASYSGDANFISSTSAVLTQTVNRAAPTISWNAPAAITYGTPLGGGQLTATANVPGTFVFSPAPGTVLNVGTSTLNATFTPTDTADYTTASASVSITVNMASSNVNLSSRPNPSLPGQAVILTATIVPQNGGTATGTVSFSDSVAGNLGTANVAGNIATLSTAALTAVGNHSITATYGGDSNVLGSTSTTLTQTVNATQPAPTTTAVHSSGSPSLVRQAVIFTARVASTFGSIPDGESISFLDGAGAHLGTGTTVGGVATLSYSGLTAGFHLILAMYPGDATFAASTSSAILQVVEKYTTTTTLSSNLNPSTYGQAIMFTATVTSAGPYRPSSNVYFLDGLTFLGAVPLNASGVAALTTANLSAGRHIITAAYQGDPLSAPSLGTFNQGVYTALTTITLTSSPNPSTFGTGVTFTATVTSPAGTPTGTVTFASGSTTLGTVTLNAGTAGISTRALPHGSDPITATYSGTQNFRGSSTSLTQQIN